MKLCIIGTGYVGLVTGACFSKFVDKVYCVDIDEQKINDLNNNIVNIYEPGLNELINLGLKNNKIEFSCDLGKCIQQCDICFITVGTPMLENGSANMQYVYDAAKTIGKSLEKYIIIVQKSTVPVGTHKEIQKIIQQELDNHNKNIDFDVVSNPEFLKEGTAVDNFMNPDRVVIGANSESCKDTMINLYRNIVKDTESIITMDVLSAEMSKYAANCMLANRISFINEMANVCEAVGANINNVVKVLGTDKRIGNHFLHPSSGYGGSCFPKDVNAMITTASDYGYDTTLLKATDKVNEDQKVRFANKIVNRFNNDLKGKSFAIWGLAYKANTNDMRGSASITLVNMLLDSGAYVKVYDPKAMKNARINYFNNLDGIEYCEDKYSALKACDALIIITEWDEFINADFTKIKDNLKSLIIYDSRNIFSYYKMNNELGFEYHQIGIQDSF